MSKRIEKDSLGELLIPNDKYYGIHSQRAINNFNISGVKVSFFPVLIKSLAKVKKCSAFANRDLGALEEKICDSIVLACDRLISGEFMDQFEIDVIQGGAGTSLNMSINEVISNIALESLGHKKGSYTIINPTEHVNMSQSTNDVYASSVKIAVYDYAQELIDEMKKLSEAFEKKGDEYDSVIKIGRTQLQDALPMTVGEQFVSYSNQINTSIEKIDLIRKSLLGLNLGGTAIGNCANTPSGYIRKIEQYVKSLISKDFFILQDLIAGTQDASCFSYVSGGIKSFSLQLSKICNDLRLLSSGPKAGLGELILPAVQVGSSIMPGKVNPVIPEMVNQSCYQVIGGDSVISFAVEGGQLELNAFLPLITFNLLNSIHILINAIKTLREKCVSGIEVDIEKNKAYVESNLSVATFLNKKIGYKKAAEIVALAMREERSIRDVVTSLKVLDDEALIEFINISGKSSCDYN